MSVLVMKYGGSSVATIDKINNVAKKIIKKKEDYDEIVVVVSAMGDTTDNLIDMSTKISKNPNKREMDVLMSVGEQVSSSLLAMTLTEMGIKAKSFTGRQAGFRTIGNHMGSEIKDVDTSRLKKDLNDGYICIVTGFQGINEEGDITTLGRGGSDTSAVALAAKLDARCEIYTDVNGIYTVDPRILDTAKKIDFLSYEETMEMAYLGAKILEPRSVSMAERFDVELYIGSSMSDEIGTLILREGEELEERSVSNISLIDDVLLVNLELEEVEGNGITDIFMDLADRDVNIDIISQNKNGKILKYISFTADFKYKYDIEKVLDEYDCVYNFIKDVSKVSVIGSGMRNQSGVAANVFKVFANNEIYFYQVSTSDISISYIIDSINREKIVKELAKEFNL